MSDVFGGSSPSGNVQSTSTSQPWDQIQPYLLRGFQQAGQNLSQGQSPYTGQAANLYAQIAQNPGNLTGQAQNLFSQTISGANNPTGNVNSYQFTDPASNPAFHSAVQDALGQAGSAYAGQYGGAAGTNLGNTGYQEGLARGLGNVATNAYSNQYNAGMAQQQNQQALGLQQGNQQLAARAQQLATAGGAPALDYANATGLQQAGTLANQSQWGPLQQYMQALQGNYGGTTTNSSPYFQNPLANAMGLGLGGLGIYNQGSTAGLWGGGGAAAGGGLSGLFSSMTAAGGEGAFGNALLDAPLMM